MVFDARTQKCFQSVAYGYVLLPVGIFLMSWTRPGIGVIATALVVLLWWNISVRKETLKVNTVEGLTVRRLYLIAVFVAAWVLLSGIAGVSFQNKDHYCRNAVYEALVNFDWPAVDETLDGGRMLVYYIGFWLPSALVGKIFGMQVGYYFQLIWAFIGIILFYGCVCIFRRRISVWPLFVFMLFSGLDAVGWVIVGQPEVVLDSTSHMEWWTIYQFSSMSTQLFWVFNQAIPAWLIIMLYLLQKDNRSLFLLSAGALLASPLPTIGMVPFVLWFSIQNTRSSTTTLWVKTWIKSLFTLENLLGISIDVILGLYMLGSPAGKVAGNSDAITVHSVLRWAGFVFLEAGIYCVLVYRSQKGQLLYITFAWLCICPLIKIGFDQDFCMRASIPALVILYIMVINTLEENVAGKRWCQTIVLLVILAIGGITSAHEIYRGVSWTMWKHINGESTWQVTIEQDDLMTRNNFSGALENNIFYEYFAAKR